MYNSCFNHEDMGCVVGNVEATSRGRKRKKPYLRVQLIQRLDRSLYVSTVYRRLDLLPGTNGCAVLLGLEVCLL